MAKENFEYQMWLWWLCLSWLCFFWLLLPLGTQWLMVDKIQYYLLFQWFTHVQKWGLSVHPFIKISSLKLIGPFLVTFFSKFNYELFNRWGLDWGIAQYTDWWGSKNGVLLSRNVITLQRKEVIFDRGRFYPIDSKSCYATKIWDSQEQGWSMGWGIYQSSKEWSFLYNLNIRRFFSRLSACLSCVVMGNFWNLENFNGDDSRWRLDVVISIKVSWGFHFLIIEGWITVGVSCQCLVWISDDGRDESWERYGCNLEF